MAEITHQKAQALLQAAADRELASEEKTRLENHLASCQACSAYSESFNAMETSLRRVIHAQWDRQQPSLNLNAIINPSPAKFFWDNLLGQTHWMRRVTIVAALLFGYILMTNLFGSQINNPDKEVPTFIPTPNELSLSQTNSPTPSAQTALVSLTPKDCIATTYVVKKDDTLANIALHHGLSKEELLKYNGLKYDMVFTGMKLMIPVCKSTPSHTATTTIIPLNGTNFPAQPE